MSTRLTFSFFLLFICLACETAKNEDTTTKDSAPEAYALDGTELHSIKRSASAQARLDSLLAGAVSAFESDPSEMNTIWYGRRLAYLNRYNEAIAVFTNGIEKHPDSYRLYRHRGHRFISTRQFSKAISDYEKAYELMPKDTTETEPDGQPNRLNIPLSNTQFNILYHYGLAHYLEGDFQKAEEIYRECMSYSINNDLLVATTDWLYMSLRRQGKEAEADKVLEQITKNMEIIENNSYFKRLMMYKGELPIEELFKTDEADISLSLATQGYGMANWYLYHGDTDKAVEIFNQIKETGNWPAFGFIAAEADAFRLSQQ